MTPFIFIGLLVGATIALRYKVFALIPATLIALIATVAAGVLLGSTGWQTVAATIVFVVAIDIGYLLITTIRFVVVGSNKPATNNSLRLSDVAY